MNDWVLRETPATGVTRLVLNRPDSFNALSSEMLSALDDALQAVAQDASCRVVVIAAGGRAFSAGHDLREMRNLQNHSRIRTPPQHGLTFAKPRKAAFAVSFPQTLNRQSAASCQ